MFHVEQDEPRLSPLQRLKHLGGRGHRQDGAVPRQRRFARQQVRPVVVHQHDELAGSFRGLFLNQGQLKASAPLELAISARPCDNGSCMTANQGLTASQLMACYFLAASTKPGFSAALPRFAPNVAA
jgi:hypothetical protein